MIYIVNEIMMKDWNDKDSVKMMMVTDNPQNIINMATKMNKSLLENIFVIEIGTPQNPIDTPIYHNLLDSPGIPIAEFLEIHTLNIKKTAKKMK